MAEEEDILGDLQDDRDEELSGPWPAVGELIIAWRNEGLNVNVCMRSR